MPTHRYENVVNDKPQGRGQDGRRGEKAAVVGGDVRHGVAFVNGAKQAPEVLPDRVRFVGVAVRGSTVVLAPNSSYR